MSVGRAYKFLVAFVAMCVAVVPVFLGSDQYHVSAAPPQPRAQGSEDRSFGTFVTCWRNNVAYSVGQPCGPKINVEACKFSQLICTNVNGSGECIAQTGNEPPNTVCGAGGPCNPPDMCDGEGSCVVKAPFSCPPEEPCVRYECSSDYTALSCVPVDKPKVNEQCDRTTGPIVCGELYWVSYTQRVPPQCGGESCVRQYQVRADPCALITCTGSVHEREFGAPNPELSYVCRDAVGVDVTALMTTRGRFQAGPGTRAQAGETYEVPFAVAPSRANYTVNTVPAKVTVKKKHVLCKVKSVTKTYGDSNPPFTFECGAFVPPDTQSSIFGSAVPTTEARRNTSTGSYAITLVAPSHVNYAITVENGTLRIDPAPVTCSTTNLTLTPDVTYSREFVESGFSVASIGGPIMGTWTFTDINGDPIRFGTRPWAPSTITVKGTFTPNSSNYTSTSCQLDISVKQCSVATVAQDCTEDDGDSCTDNACDEATGMCFNKPKGPSVTGSLNPVMTLTCPDTIQVDFNDVFQCADTTSLYRLGIGTRPVSYANDRGSLLSMDDTVVPRSSCSNGRCRFVTNAITFYREPNPGVPPRLSPPLHVGVAALAGQHLLLEGVDEKPVSCGGGSPCSGKTCGPNETLKANCECGPPGDLCGNGVLDPGEECDQSAGINGNCDGYGCVNCRRDYNASCASLFTERCTGDGSSLSIVWGPNVTFQVDTSMYRCPSDSSCCPPVSPPDNTSSKSAARLCARSAKATYGHDYDIRSACPHGRRAEPPTYHISCTCNQTSTVKKCISAKDGVSDASIYLGEAQPGGG